MKATKKVAVKKKVSKKVVTIEKFIALKNIPKRRGNPGKRRECPLCSFVGGTRETRAHCVARHDLGWLVGGRP